MPIGKLTLEISIPHAQSLKDRRQVVRSLKDKLRHAFNLSVAELNEGATIWNQATIAVAVISSSTQSVQQHLESIDRAAQRICLNLSAEIVDSWAEIVGDHDEQPKSLAKECSNMPEQRARTYHRNRVAQTFSDEIGAMLEGELTDPRLFPSVVTDVVLAPGGKSARVFIAVHGGDAEEASTLDALTSARGFIRSQIRDRMGVRHVPELSFAIDRSEKMTGRMDELLGRARKRDAKRKPTPLEPDAPAS